MKYVIKSTSGLVLMPSKEDPRVRRWQNPAGEYTQKKDIPRPTTEYEGNEGDWEKYFEQEKDWKNEIGSAIAEGRLNARDAVKLGYFLNIGEGEVTELPKVLYHVTTAKNTVLKEGLKTREQLRQGSGKGLGGGQRDTISFTADESIAKGIYSGILEAIKVAKGEITGEQMVRDAAMGNGAKKQWLTTMLDYWRMEKAKNEFLRGDKKVVEDVVKQVESMINYDKETGWPKTEQQFNEEQGKKLYRPHTDWKGVEPPFRYVDGKPVYQNFIREKTSREKLDSRMEIYKQFSAFRENAGGPLDPLFFSNDEEALLGMDLKDIGILKFEGKGDGFKVSGLGEWRTFSGANVGAAEDITERLTKSEKYGFDKKIATMSLLWSVLRKMPKSSSSVKEEKEMKYVIKSVQVKGFTRTRKGKMERVKPHSRDQAMQERRREKLRALGGNKKLGEPYSVATEDLEEFSKLATKYANSKKLMTDDTRETLKMLKLGGGSDLTFAARSTATEMGHFLQDIPELIRLVPEKEVPFLMDILEQNNSTAFNRVKDYLKIGEPYSSTKDLRHIEIDVKPGTRRTKEWKIKEALEENSNTINSPKYLNAKVKKDINGDLHEISTKHHTHFPIDEIFGVLEKRGIVVLQEDNTKFSGFFLGENAQTYFPVAPVGSKHTVSQSHTDRNYEAYIPFKNSVLTLGWYTMSSGRYEITTYIG